MEDAIRRAADPTALMKRIADEAMSLVPGIDGVLVGMVHDPCWVTFECGAGKVEQHIGERVFVEASLAGLAYRSGEAVRSDDVRNDPCADFDLARSVGARSLVCVPIWRRDVTVGVLCVFSFHPHNFHDRDMATLTSLAEFISVFIAVAFDLASVTDTLLSQAARNRGTEHREADMEAEERFVANVLSPGAMTRIERRSWVDRFLRGQGLTHAFQPIFDIRTGECFAVEALARFSGQPNRPPDVWFAEAHEMGVGVELELVSVKRALRCLEKLPPDVDLCVNAGPGAMASDDLARLLKLSEPGRVVFELTEETRVDDYPRLSLVLDRLYAMGVRLAIDDTGAGFASLAHILKLVPNVIKLDRELIAGIDRDPVRATLAMALVSFASGLRAEVVAEGIENSNELEMVRDLGIGYGQGFLLCRPVSLGEIPVSLPPELTTSKVRHAPRLGMGQVLPFPVRPGWSASK